MAKQTIFFNQVEHVLQDHLLHHDVMNNIPVLYIHPVSLVRVLTILRDHHLFLFKQLVDIVAIDYPGRLQRFELTYHLLSLQNNERVFLKVGVKDKEEVSTVTHILPNAHWYEREVWDMMGVIFKNNPNLERILTDYTFEGHPLRKDFPLTGYTQVYYDQEKQKVSYQPVALEQNYRKFDFESPWVDQK